MENPLMYALIKKQKGELTAHYILPSISDPVELKHLDGSEWTLVEWNVDLVKSDVWNELVTCGAIFRDTGEEINQIIKENFQEKL